MGKSKKNKSKTKNKHKRTQSVANEPIRVVENEPTLNVLDEVSDILESSLFDDEYEPKKTAAVLDTQRSPDSVLGYKSDEEADSISLTQDQDYDYEIKNNIQIESEPTMQPLSVMSPQEVMVDQSNVQFLLSVNVGSHSHLLFEELRSQHNSDALALNKTLWKLIELGHSSAEAIAAASQSTDQFESLASQKLERLETQITGLHNSLFKSSNKGAVIETGLTDLIARQWPSWSVENIGSAKSYQTDIHVYDPDHDLNFAIESKSYTTNVPSAQVKKFVRDVKLMMESEQPLDGAIMFSTGSGIVGKGNFQIETIRHAGQTTVLIYVHRCGLANSIVTGAIQLMSSVVGLVKSGRLTITDDQEIDNNNNKGLKFKSSTMQALWDGLHAHITNLNMIMPGLNMVNTQLGELSAIAESAKQNTTTVMQTLNNAIDMFCQDIESLEHAIGSKVKFTPPSYASNVATVRGQLLSLTTTEHDVETISTNSSEPMSSSSSSSSSSKPELKFDRLMAKIDAFDPETNSAINSSIHLIYNEARNEIMKRLEQIHEEDIAAFTDYYSKFKLKQIGNFQFTILFKKTHIINVNPKVNEIVLTGMDGIVHATCDRQRGPLIAKDVVNEAFDEISKRIGKNRSKQKK